VINGGAFVTNRSTRALSNMAKLKFALSESESNESQKPMKMLLVVKSASLIVTIHSPSMDHSTVLPILRIRTSRQAKPAVPTASAPDCA